jgi:hypothetical protein
MKFNIDIISYIEAYFHKGLKSHFLSGCLIYIPSLILTRWPYNAPIGALRVCNLLWGLGLAKWAAYDRRWRLCLQQIGALGVAIAVVGLKTVLNKRISRGDYIPLRTTNPTIAFGDLRLGFLKIRRQNPFEQSKIVKSAWP